ncbi:DUF6894 family protein [Methylobacterium dankookense]|uniref:DUF6894 family protein n=1 Tax=Methylobacterium dankookense TaxID=560405 RepID=UPI0011A64CEB|nr:hypothetical protein [Methylobacterium dankookense]
MPKYFIDTDDGNTRRQDEVEYDLADDYAARREAQYALPGMVQENILDSEYRIFIATVRNERGEAVYTATLTLEGTWHGPAGERRSPKR